MVKILDYCENTGEYNMKFDEQLLNEAIKDGSKEMILRFYGWSPPCVSLGRNQSEKNINTEYCKKHNIDVIRRPTGGRGLFHDKEITYSVICSADILNNGTSVINSYKEICNALILGFKTLGIVLTLGTQKQRKISHDYCMLLSTGADLCFSNKKLIGSAQYRRQNYILQHGSILMDYNPAILKKIFNETANKSEITCIKEINPSLSREDIIFALKRSFLDWSR